MNDRDYVKQTLQAWAGSWPRRVTKYQRWATSVTEATELLLEAERDPNNWPFISTYSFPDGHTKDDAIPQVDRLFIDMDVPDTGEYRSGREREDAWIRDMSRLLVRVRKVATFLLNAKDPGCWQAVLSGHKGVHLDLVFPPVSSSNGTFSQFGTGMDSFADSIGTHLIESTNMDDLEDYIDVSSADLGRMRRVPNTLHRGATESFGEDRFCVPVSIRELASIKPSDYIDLTRSRRPVTDDMRATPNEKAGEVLTQQIRNASVGGFREGTGGSSSDVSRLTEYVENQNERIGVSDLPFVLSDRPCVLAFIEREDAFQHRSSSHLMEMKAITEMAEKNVPIELRRDPDGEVLAKRDRPTVTGGTMVDVFAQHPDFDENYTCERIDEYISRGYNPVSCEKIWDKADQFCLGSECQIWQDAQTQ